MTRLTVVMTVYNGERYLREAIDSVLAQSVADFEFLIVDDASTDRTPEMLAEKAQRDSRIRVVRNNSNLGPYPSLNRALTIASGSIIARQDADDISPPDRFAVQLAAFESHSDVSLVTGAIDVFDDEDPKVKMRIQPPSWQPRLEWELMFSNVVGGGGHVMFPRNLHGEPILYSTARRYSEDYGLWCRLARVGTVVCPTQAIYRYRRHASSITGARKAEQDACVAAIRREYRAPYVPSGMPPEVGDELSRFWTTDGGRPLAVGMRAIYAGLASVRSNFLAYAARRYGAAESSRLEAELNDATRDRLAYWLFRSARMLDARSSFELLKVGETLHVFSRTLGYVTHAALAKLVPRRGR